MSNRSPIFPVPDSQQFFTDYGLNSQLYSSQVVEEARKQKKARAAQAPTPHNFKRSKRWLKNAFHFIRAKITHCRPIHKTTQELQNVSSSVRSAPLSGPLYITESRGTRVTRHRTTRSRSSSGQLFPMGQCNSSSIPYISLREQQHPISTSLPIYLVT